VCGLGIATLFPWNCFLNTIGLLGKDGLFGGSVYEDVFASAFSTFFLSMNFAFLAAAMYWNLPSKLVASDVKMITCSVGVIAVLFFGMLLDVSLLQGKPRALFWTMGPCLAITGCAACILQSHVLAYASSLDTNGTLTQYCMTGQAIAGIIASLLLLATVLFSASMHPLSIIRLYYLLVIFVLGGSLFFFLWVQSKRQHPEVYSQVELDVICQREEDNGTEDPTPMAIKAPPVCSCSAFGVCVFSCFCCTLSIFPGITSLISPFGIPDMYFHPLLVFTFSCADLLGRLLASKVGPKDTNGQLCYAVLRWGLGIPFVFCNVPKTKLWVVFENDYWPVVFIFILGLTGGHLATLSMVEGCKHWSPSAMTLCLNGGLVTGASISNVFAGALVT